MMNSRWRSSIDVSVDTRFDDMDGDHSRNAFDQVDVPNPNLPQSESWSSTLLTLGRVEGEVTAKVVHSVGTALEVEVGSCGPVALSAVSSLDSRRLLLDLGDSLNDGRPLR